jgi:uncharacterized protein (TIRG00374 family)
MRKLIPALVILLALYLALSRFTEVQQVAATLQRGHWYWIGLAVGMQFVWLMNFALTFRAVYHLVGLEASLRQLLPLVATSHFVNITAPTGGFSGLAVFVADARRRQLSIPRVTIAGVLNVLFDYFGFLCVLAVGLSVLIRRNNLHPGDVAASILLLGVALTLAGLLALGVRSAQALDRALTWATRAINAVVRPFLRRDYLSEARAHTFAAEAAEGLSALKTGWRGYLLPAAHALFGKALLISILFLTFLAFDQPFSTGTLIAGFSIGYLFLIVSPTPAGLGIVEGVMTLSLRSLGVPLEAATIITLAYRGLTFWLPFGYGFIALRVLQRRWQA